MMFESPLAMSNDVARPRLLDLFCAEGGAGMGYHLAGFDVFGVDNARRDRIFRNPFDCAKADAIEYLLAHGHEFDAIHASPPCTGYTRGTAAIPDRLQRYDRLIAVTREALEIVGKPYVIENVEHAKSEMRDPVTLCWTHFHEPGSVVDEDGTPLWMRRHRLFESNVPLTAPGGCRHPKRLRHLDGWMQCAGGYDGARHDKPGAHHRRGGYVPSASVLRELLGTPWMTEKGCYFAVPPVFTEWVGLQLLDAIEEEAA